MLTGKKARVEKFLNATRQFIVGVDTPEEVRSFTGYRFIVGLGDEMEALGMPSGLACRAAARVVVSLPMGFHEEFPDEFIELIRLWAKSMSVTHEALSVDYDKSVVNDMFLSMCDKIVVEFNWS